MFLLRMHFKRNCYKQMTRRDPMLNILSLEKEFLFSNMAIGAVLVDFLRGC